VRRFVVRGRSAFPACITAVRWMPMSVRVVAERDVAMMLDFDPAVVAFSSQPFWLTWSRTQCAAARPDYFARWLMDGVWSMSAPMTGSNRGMRKRLPRPGCLRESAGVPRTAGPARCWRRTCGGWPATGTGVLPRRCRRVLAGVFAEPKPLMADP